MALITGLTNEGNTCYMNSALQCLLHIPDIQQYFGLGVQDVSLVPYQSQIKYFPHNRSNVLREFGDQIQKLMVSLSDESDTRPVRPLSFRRVLSIFKPMYRSAEQQDAHECLTFILDTLHESLKISVSINISGAVRNLGEERKSNAFNQYKNYLSKMGYSEVTKMFCGQFDSTILCKSCGKCSYSYDPYSSMEVEIPDNGNTLYDCLDNYCYQELLSADDAYSCEGCKTKVDATKVLKIWTLPKVMIIQLKRFNSQGGPNVMGLRNMLKNNRHIQFPTTLNMTKYVTNPTVREPGSTGDQINGLQLFNLIGVIEHSGSLHGGHYTAKCDVNGGLSQTPRWMSFNDTHVSPIDEASIVSTNAYVLIYRMSEHTQKIWKK